jgi:hypothetical protein
MIHASESVEVAASPTKAGNIHSLPGGRCPYSDRLFPGWNAPASPGAQSKPSAYTLDALQIGYGNPDPSIERNRNCCPNAVIVTIAPRPCIDWRVTYPWSTAFSQTVSLGQDVRQTSITSG